MKKRIMIADDEEDVRETLRIILEKEGYETCIAKDSADLLEKIKKNKPDLILLDIMMPGPPIKKIVPQIKNKIIFLTVLSISDEEKKELTKYKNTIDFVEKNLGYKDLIKRIKKAFQ